MNKKPDQKDKNTILKEVKNLFAQADIAFKTNKAKASLLVKKARKTAMRVRLRLPKELKRKFCKHCYSYLKPGINARIRIHKSRVIIYCLDCKKFTRIPLK